MIFFFFVRVYLRQLGPWPFSRNNFSDNTGPDYIRQSEGAFAIPKKTHWFFRLPVE